MTDNYKGLTLTFEETIFLFLLLENVLRFLGQSELPEEAKKHIKEKGASLFEKLRFTIFEPEGK